MVLAAVCCWNLVSAQAAFPFQVRKRLDIGLITSGVVTTAGGALLGSQLKQLTPMELMAQNASDIRWAIDRRAVQQRSIRSAKVSDVLVIFSAAAPVSLLLARPVRHYEPIRTVAVMGVEALFIQEGLKQLVKNSVQRNRPFTYNPNAPEQWLVKPDARRSFFSGHTSAAATATFFAATVFSKMYPHSRWRVAVWSGAAVLPAVVGYYRYKAGKHFPTDIAAGYLVGAACGVSIPLLHLRR